MTTENALTTTNGTTALARPGRDLTIIHDDPRLRYEPTNWAEATKAAEALYRSGLLPSGIKSPQAAVALIVYGAERGLSLMQSLTSVYVVEGRPSMSAEMMVALVLASPQCEWFHLVESTRDRAVYECKRRGDPKPIPYAYTTDDARDAGLLGRGTWQKHQRAMLRARASAGLCRIAFPDVTAGVYTPDEQEDVRESRRIPSEGGAAEMPIAESKPSARDAIIAEARALPAATEVLAEARTSAPDPVTAAEDARVERLRDGAKGRYAALEAATKRAGMAKRSLAELSVRLFNRGVAALNDDQIAQLVAEVESAADNAEREPGADG